MIQVDIPPTRSGFAARAAWVYLPPAWFAADRPLLPVLMLIGGQPGGPRDWLDGGRLAQRMDAWAAAHGGLAPVVVMPDALGGPVADPMCLDSALGRTDTYLSQDVPAWVTSTLHVDPDHTHWAVGGFSFGGTCALQLAVGHPDLFPTFFDASGQQGPTLGDAAKTVAVAFHGDEAAYAAHDPLTVLRSRQWSGIRRLPRRRQAGRRLRAAGAHRGRRSDGRRPGRDPDRGPRGAQLGRVAGRLRPGPALAGHADGAHAVTAAVRLRAALAGRGPSCAAIP